MTLAPTPPRRRPALLTALSIAGVATIALSGCASSDSAATEPSTAAALEPQSGGTWIHAVSGIPECIDISQGNFPIHPGQSLVDNLFEQDPATGELTPWLAESYEVSDDATQFTFHLKDGVTFSNGEALDADAVKQTFENAIELGKIGKSPLAASYLLDYEGSEVVDDLTLTTTFSQPKASFLQALSDKPLGILAPENFTKTPEERCVDGAIGSGPFVVDTIVPGQSVTLTRRDGYAWASPLAINKGEAYLDAITFQIASEPSIATGSLISGQLNSISATGDALTQVEAAGLDVTSQVSGGLALTLVLNLSKPAFAETAVRQALAAAIDRDDYVQVAANSYVRPASSIFGSNVPGYADLSEALATDVDAANELLDNAGWVAGADGIREKNGIRLSGTAKFVGTNAGLELIQQQWAAIGAELVLAPATQAEVTEWAAGADWDVQLTSLSRTDPDVLLSVLDPQFSARAKLWPDFYPELLEKIRAQARETDPAERQKLVLEIQQEVIEEAYQIPVTENTGIFAQAEGSHGLWVSSLAKPFFHQAWIDQD